MELTFIVLFVLVCTVAWPPLQGYWMHREAERRLHPLVALRFGNHAPFALERDEVTWQQLADWLNELHHRERITMLGDRDDHKPRFVARGEAILLDLHSSYRGLARDEHGRFSPQSGRAQFPVEGISFDGASQFCRFYGRRLPTSDEWALAAGGESNRSLPWGKEPPPSCDDAVFARDRDTPGGPTCGGRGRDGADPIDEAARDVTPEGIRHLFGNVSEFVVDPNRPNDWVYRGANYNSPWEIGLPDHVETLPRVDEPRPARMKLGLGFRCAR